MRKPVFILALVLLIGGLAVLLYPHIQQFLYARHAANMIADFEARLETYRAESDDGTLSALHEKIVAYNRNLYLTGQDRFVDPFSYEQVDFSLRYFGFEEEMIGAIHIERMNITLPIFLGASQYNLSRGAAHLTQTSLPIGGENTNAVIAAHRGMGTAAMFRDIERLETGDRIRITNFYQSIDYVVTETRVILPTQVYNVLIQSGRDLLTLITCHPYRSNHQRYLVFAERVRDVS